MEELSASVVAISIQLEQSEQSLKAAVFQLLFKNRRA